MARTSLVRIARRIPDDELLAVLPHLPRRALLSLHRAFCPEECSCPRVALPCGCEQTQTPCDCEPDYAPCPHFRQYYFPWPIQVAICELLWPDPPPPPAGSPALDREVMAEIRAIRRGQRVSLWHPDDWINNQELLGERLQRFQEGACRLRNGHTVAGAVGVVGDDDDGGRDAA